MNEKKFKIKEAINYGWQVTKSKIGFFIVLILIFFILDYGPSYINDRLFTDYQLIYALITLFSFVLSLIISLGLINISLKIYDQKEVSIFDLFSCWRLFFKLLLTSVIYILIVFLGLLLLIIPGIIWVIKFQFYSYFIIEGSGPIEALEKSGIITKGAKWDLFWLGLILLLLMLLGILALIIGFFIAYPVCLMAMAYVYRKLQSYQPTSNQTNLSSNNIS